MSSDCRKLMSQYLRKYREPPLEDEIKQRTRGKKLTDQQERRLKKELQETSPFFMNRKDEPLTNNGLYQMISRLGEWAKITRVRCSPHTLRHSFAVAYLLQGGDVFKLSLCRLVLGRFWFFHKT